MLTVNRLENDFSKIKIVKNKYNCSDFYKNFYKAWKLLPFFGVILSSVICSYSVSSSLILKINSLNFDLTKYFINLMKIKYFFEI